MTRMMALMAVVALAGSAIASEEEAVQLKITVDGMSCPTGCAPKVAKGLQGIAGAKEVKLADFDKGLFTMAFDAKTAVSPDAFKKAVDGYKITKIEMTITGKIALDAKKNVVLTTAAGTPYVLTIGAPPECCKDDKAAPKAEAPKAEESPLLKTLRTKLDTFAKEGKTAKVIGVMAECCDISITVASIDAVEKATN